MADRNQTCALRAPSRRRILSAGLGGALALPFLRRPLLAAASLSRDFEILRAGETIGRQTTTVADLGDEIEVRVEARIAVKLLGVTVYRYALDSRERWRDGALVSLQGATDDDGEAQRVEIAREAGKLVSKGTWRGELPEGCGTTTYWTQAFLDRPVWISTQTGAPQNVRAAQDGRETIAGPDGAVDCARWQVRGDIDLTLYYDDRGEWMGSAFEAGGEQARFRAQTGGAALAALWGTR